MTDKNAAKESTLSTFSSSMKEKTGNADFSADPHNAGSPVNKFLAATKKTLFNKDLLMQAPATFEEKDPSADRNYNPFRGYRRPVSARTTVPANPLQHHSNVVQGLNKKPNYFSAKLNQITFDFLDSGRVRKMYRQDIDGLRGFACLLVAVFHIWIHRTSGGVDVFLTVSGFFFLPSLLRKVSQPDFRLKDFNPWPNIRAILRRLWPAMIVILFAIFLLSWKLLPTSSRTDILKQVGASLTFYENWYMYNNNRSYLTASSNVSPMQHLWSMAIQGQFFITTILLVFGVGLLVRLIVRRFGRNDAKAALWFMLITAFTITLLSFWWGVRTVNSGSSVGYYDTFARVWEPLAGGLIGIFSTSIILPRIVREVISISGLVAIFVIGLIIQGTDEFPGPWALVPVLSTLAIISAYNPRYEYDSMPFMNQVLSGKVFQWFGRVSYGLYLWHWPLLIMFLAWRPYIEIPSFVHGTLLIAISVTLAWLTAKYVENPIRYQKPLAFPIISSAHKAPPSILLQGTWAKITYFADRIYRHALIFILVVFIVIMGSTQYTWNKKISREKRVVPTPIEQYPGARVFLNHAIAPPGLPPQPPLKNSVFGDLPITTLDGKILDFEAEGTPVLGEYGDKNAKRLIVVAGGSHAEHWMAAMNDIAKKFHYRIITILRMGCELSTNEHPLKPASHKPYVACAEWEKQAIQKIIDLKPDYLFTTVTRPREGKGQQGDWVPPDYIGAFKKFRDANIQILGMRDTPWPHIHTKGQVQSPADCVSDHQVTPESFYECGVSFERALDDINPAISALKDFPNIHLLDLTAGICDLKRRYCPAVVGNVLVWHDLHHLSTVFTRTLEPELIRQLTPIMKLPVPHKDDSTKVPAPSEPSSSTVKPSSNSPATTTAPSPPHK